MTLVSLSQTKQVNQRLGMDQPAAYHIEVQGWFDRRWSDWFDGMAVAVENGQGVAPTTPTSQKN